MQRHRYQRSSTLNVTGLQGRPAPAGRGFGIAKFVVYSMRK